MRITTRGACNNHAIVILDGPKSAALKVFACSAKSREAGISVGMSKAKAEIWPNVLMLRRCQQNEDIAQTALLDCGFSVSRQVESTHPGTVLCDVTGTEKLLGSPKKIAEKLHGLTTQCGFTASIAIASNPDAALHAARGFSGITIVPFGKERDVLARLPIDILDSRPEILEALRNCGIRTFKDLAALPMPAIAQRFGPAGVRLQQMAKGVSKRELIPVIPTTSFQERIEPEEPLDCLAGINVVLQTLLDQTLVRLKARSLAAKEIHVELGIEKTFDWDLRQIEAGERSVKRSSDLRKIQFSDVTQDAELIFKLLQLELERRPPQGCVREISIEAIPAKMRFVQHDFLRANAPESVNLDLSLAHLRALNCENEQEAKNRVGFAVVNDSHNPNSFYVTNCLPQIPANAERELRDDERLKEPCYGIGRRINSRLKLRSKSDDGNTDVIMKGKKNRIATAAGPWFGNGDWWDKEHHWNREEWDLELQSRRRKGLYRSIHPTDSNEWFIERMYD
jgi:protein ImuB